MKHLCLLLLFQLLFIFSVSNCTTIKCALAFGQITLQSYGYTLEDMDTILVQWYEPGSHFTNMVREQLFCLSGTSAYPNVGGAPHLVINDIAIPIDSFRLPFDFVDPIADSYLANDVLITVPAINRSFEVTDVLIRGDYRQVTNGAAYSRSFDDCKRHVTSFKVDGATVTNNVIVAIPRFD